MAKPLTRCEECNAVLPDHMPTCSQSVADVEVFLGEDEVRVVASRAIRVGDVWIDPKRVAWYVQSVDVDGQVRFRREIVADEDPRVVARTWRKMNEEAGALTPPDTSSP